MLLHDIGKVNTFTVDPRGQGHFYGHPRVSGDMAEEICARLRMRKRDRENIVTLIRWHDKNIPLTEKGIGTAMLALGEENFRRLLEVKRADNLAQAPEYRWVAEKIDAAEKLLDEMLRREPCLQLKDLAVNGMICWLWATLGGRSGWPCSGCCRRLSPGRSRIDGRPCLRR